MQEPADLDDSPAILMPPEADVRWRQRFANYCRALELLEGFFEPAELNVREEQGLIKAFEYTFELGWNTLRDLLRSEGNTDLIDSRDTLREAFRVGLSHIRSSYLDCFRQLRTSLEQRQP